MFWGYRSARYYVVAFWSRIAASGVSVSGFFRAPDTLGNKAAKRANPDGQTVSFGSNIDIFFKPVLILFCLCCVVMEVAISQEVHICVSFRLSQGMSRLIHV